jgi:hypothetical protein
MEILVLILTHLLAFLGGLYLNKHINTHPISNQVKKMVSKKAEIIEEFNLDNIEI